MKQSIAHVALVVRDYDEAIAFYTQTLGFRLVEDEYQPAQGKRWVVVAPPGSAGTTLLLARASSPQQLTFVGNQAGGRVFLFLATDDFWRDYSRMLAAGVRFVRPPSDEAYGVVAVFEDLYGNRWDLVEYRRGSASAEALPTLETWNAQVLALVQALLGGVSPNMRLVGLRYASGWRIVVVLEQESAADREEIEDLVFEFQALQEGPLEVAVDVEVDARCELPWPAEPVRVVYRRREQDEAGAP